MSRHPLRPSTLLAGLAFLTLAVAGLAASSGRIEDGAAGMENGDVVDDTLVITALAWAMTLAAVGIVTMIRRMGREIAHEAAANETWVDEPEADEAAADEQAPLVNDAVIPERL